MSELITIKETEALQAKNVETLRDLIVRQGAQIEQLAAAVISLDARLAEVTKAAQSVTVSHKQVKQLQGMIRDRAEEVREKNGIADPKAAAAFKAAIKKDLMAAWGVSDLHDLPLSAWDRAVWAVGSWSRYAVIKQWKYGPTSSTASRSPFPKGEGKDGSGATPSPEGKAGPHPAASAATFPRVEDRTSSTASRSPVRGCRPAYAENSPPDCFPGATAPRGEGRTSSVAFGDTFPRGEGKNSDEEGKACSAL